ncbi:phosphotransferase family protein [Sphingomonas colocasiae]|uniref:Phosphotransferase family protein n=2 Tax=Sphingomonas colocasiae TaxID=1848973 RepID=A0ABS7PVC5_9SPHN|nr:phosphotransferase family protein [Sphingomonas colocasiae]MBY8824327.1 phosphotransferase family protein [Sphingomonas colocasiae]
MDGEGLARGPIEAVTPLTGGTQNQVLRFSKGGCDFVLRCPPPTPRPESNATMRREARVLAALAETDVPHPRLIAACSDESVLGVACYLMDPIDGFNPVNGLPPLHAADPAVRRAMGLAFVDGAAALSRVDHLAVGLGDFGKPENFLERQTARWRSQLEGYAKHDGWPGPGELPGVDTIADYLEANRPADFQPGIIHGDYLLGNVMFRNDGPGLAAIIDWELATIGDPLIDLGWLLATWRGVPPEDLPVLAVEPWDGFPVPEELVARYAEKSGRDVSAIDWYFVLACYKLGIILEGTFARACAGRDPMDQGGRLHQTAITLFRRALHRIG